MTITTPLVGWFLLFWFFWSYIASAIPEIWMVPSKFKMGHVTSPCPFQGHFVPSRLRRGCVPNFKSLHSPSTRSVCPVQRYERWQKVQKFGWFGRVRGYPRSSETSPFDRAHMTSYSTLIETMCLSCTVFELLLLISRIWKRHITVTMPTQGKVCGANAIASHGESVHKIWIV